MVTRVNGPVNENTGNQMEAGQTVDGGVRPLIAHALEPVVAQLHGEVAQIAQQQADRILEPVRRNLEESVNRALEAARLTLCQQVDDAVDAVRTSMQRQVDMTLEPLQSTLRNHMATSLDPLWSAASAGPGSSNAVDKPKRSRKSTAAAETTSRQRRRTQSSKAASHDKRTGAEAPDGSAEASRPAVHKSSGRTHVDKGRKSASTEDASKGASVRSFNAPSAHDGSDAGSSPRRSRPRSSTSTHSSGTTERRRKPASRERSHRA